MPLRRAYLEESIPSPPTRPEPETLVHPTDIDSEEDNDANYTIRTTSINRPTRIQPVAPGFEDRNDLVFNPTGSDVDVVVATFIPPPTSLSHSEALSMVETAWEQREQALTLAYNALTRNVNVTSSDVAFAGHAGPWLGAFEDWLCNSGRADVFMCPKGHAATMVMSGSELEICAWGELWDRAFETMRTFLREVHYLDAACVSDVLINSSNRRYTTVRDDHVEVDQVHLALHALYEYEFRREYFLVESQSRLPASRLFPTRQVCKRRFYDLAVRQKFNDERIYQHNSKVVETREIASNEHKKIPVRSLGG